ncbi:UbiA prenyltransferase family [Cyathus striatus]|nr:UbiA prenyltransferase family [Cyathus striatus]
MAAMKPTGVRASITEFFRTAVSFLYTLYLFTKSDTLLVIVPMLTVAVVLAGPGDIYTFLISFLWLELHLLAFEIKNQLIGVDEDRICKPYRPFPSDRITLSQGNALYYSVVATCFLFSLFHGLLLVTSVYFLATVSYNEFELAANPIAKSPIGAIGYMCYCWGTTYILGQHVSLSMTSVKAIVASGLIFSLTGHAQDFKDRSGDAVLGRKTIPIVFSQFTARWSLVLAMFGFTWGLIIIWGPPMIVSVIFVLLSAICSFQFLNDHSEVSDRKSFKWYEVRPVFFWLAFISNIPPPIVMVDLCSFSSFI